MGRRKSGSVLPHADWANTHPSWDACTGECLVEKGTSSTTVYPKLMLEEILKPAASNDVYTHALACFTACFANTMREDQVQAYTDMFTAVVTRMKTVRGTEQGQKGAS
jgi:hypothetical protein